MLCRLEFQVNRYHHEYAFVFPDVKVIQVDISSEEIGNNVPATVGLVGDVRAIAGQLTDALVATRWKFSPDSPWWTELKAKVHFCLCLCSFRVWVLAFTGTLLDVITVLRCAHTHFPNVACACCLILALHDATITFTA